MEMTFRWFGSKYDSITLEQIRQIPGVHGVITTLYGSNPGEAWAQEEVNALKTEVEQAGLKIAGIESVNIHDDIKTGAASRDKYIE
ncbi:MAG: mannonate dehydratase, partial [Spirochaetaceae bacterium]|nr:mannonate dehydratase [Spirochaetaceae bacterium]